LNTSGKKYRNIVFDLGKVLWKIDYDGWLDHVRSYNPKITKAVLDNFIETVVVEADKGKTDKAALVKEYEYFLNKKNLSFEVVFSIQNKLLSLGPTPAMRLLPDLKKKYKLFLLSNTNPWHIEYVEESYPAFREFFEKRIYSFDAGYVKPSPEIFKYFFDKTSINASESVYFDDMEANAATGRSYGLDSFIVNDEYEFYEFLQELLISIKK
jgi:HAD superfamily hydrolase (TIGR01509 family)